MNLSDAVHRFFIDHFQRVGEIRQFDSSYVVKQKYTVNEGKLAQPFQFKVLTLNIWGLPISPCLQERIAHIETLFEREMYDVCVFQECTCKRETKALVEMGHRYGLAYHHQFLQGVGMPLWLDVSGPGLLVLARYPITDMAYKRFSVNGKMHKPHHADYFGAKGVGLVRIDLTQGYRQYQALHQHMDDEDGNTDNDCIYGGDGEGQIGVDIFTTHLHANYGSNVLDDEYYAHRVSQAYELGKFIESMRRPHHLCILAGDLNTDPTDICTHLIQHIPNLHDSFALCNPSEIFTAYTIHAPDNTFSPFYKPDYTENYEKDEYERYIPVKWPTSLNGKFVEPPMRIDYIMYSLPITAAPSTSLVSPFLPSAPIFSYEVVDSHIVKQYATIRNQRTSISDHFGVSTTFQLVDANHLHALSQAERQAAKSVGIRTPQPSSPRSLSTPADSLTRSMRSSSSPHINAIQTTSIPPITLNGVDEPVHALGSALDAAISALSHGLTDVITRKKQHWMRAIVALFLFLFLRQPLITGWFTYIITSLITYIPILTPILFPTLPSFHLILWLLPLYTLTEWVLAQFLLSDESTAIQQTLAEVTIYRDTVKRRMKRRMSMME